MHSYIIEHRTKDDPHWRAYQQAPLFAGWTARKTVFDTDAAASEACRELSRLGSSRGEEHRVIRVRSTPRAPLPAQWKRNIGAVGIDKTVDDVRARLSELEGKRARLEAVLNELLSRTKVRCTAGVDPRRAFHQKGCGKESAIQDIVYLQTHWYVPPSGCTDGDYWRQGEGQYECPHCGHVNRLHNLPEIERLSHLFRGVVQVYDRS